MSLPILNVSGSDLLRLFEKTEMHVAQQLGEEEWLSCGAAFGDHVRQAALVEGMTPAAAVGEVEGWFARKGGRCEYWVMNPSAEEGRVRPLVDHLVGNGWMTEKRDVMYLRGTAGGAAEVTGVSVIPARASYRHARELAEEAGDVELDAGRLDDPHCEGLLALVDGRVAGRVYVVAVGEIGRVGWLYVAKEFRGREIELVLMLRALEACARSMFRHVFVGVDPRDEAAVRVYERFGFGKIGEAVRYRRQGWEGLAQDCVRTA